MLSLQYKKYFLHMFFTKNIFKKKVDDRSRKENCKKAYAKYKVFGFFTKDEIVNHEG